MWLGIITLFPDMFAAITREGVFGRAVASEIVSLEFFNPRDYTTDRHRTVDDRPYGGGAGMVMRADVLGRAITHARRGVRGRAPILYMSPRGRPLTQAMAQELSTTDGVTILCGRFEGVDERVIEHFGIHEVSIGDYVLTGGELAAQILLDATVRLMPKVLGNAASTEDESFSAGLLEHPQYTRPPTWNGLSIPEVLQSGHHGNIEKWRREMAKQLTQSRRPDLYEKRSKKIKDP